MGFSGRYLRQYRAAAWGFVLFVMIFLGAFFLYQLPLGAVLYPALLCGLLGGLFLLVDYGRCLQRHRRLTELAKLPGALMEGFPETRRVEEEDYRQIVEELKGAQRELENRMEQRYGDMVDYYTLWAHQIKTPIASMRLKLQKEDSPLSRRVREDLFRIEQYVEMVLAFLRLDSDTTDYVIREYEVDGIVRQAVRRYAGAFIGRRIGLCYEPAAASVVTDEKWLLFVLEQLLDNALKYTPENGTVTIGWEEPGTLWIRDTGIGIAPEDLPRIFERGYTGYNGRADKRASGIGLYLCRRVCQNLGHGLTAESAPEQGTTVRLVLARQKDVS
ncbi:MAG: HAMP domain-containing histidine kinase [Lachnospiraceae bacterium]|nr:HAMP domain-containing histidine kinase [Lachnospiraceae bacterium]